MKERYYTRKWKRKIEKITDPYRVQNNLRIRVLNLFREAILVLVTLSNSSKITGKMHL